MPNRDNESWATIWQGFHHAWEYNHRLNRLGSYVKHEGDRPASGQSLAGHTAASGTGGDTAHFSEFVTRVRAAGVGSQTGWREVRVECPRAVTASFRIPVDGLALEPDLVGRERHAVVINGFDLCADHHADKLIAFDLEVTDPVVTAEGTKIRFDILGSLRFDCRTAECQLWPVALEVEEVGRRGRPPVTDEPPSPPGGERRRRGIQKRPAIEQAVNWLKRQVATLTDLGTLKQGMLGREEDRMRRRLFRLFGRQFVLRVLKWRIVTPYTLRVAYAIVGGDADALAITESEAFENSYSWDTETEIEREALGTQRLTVEGEDPQAYDVNTFGFRQLSLETTLDQAFGTSNPIQWGTGMHLLEWDAAVRAIAAVDGRVEAELDLFYKAWSEAMNQVITLTTWGALRSAGCATLRAKLTLLQFKDATAEAGLKLPGQIRWPGGGLSARDHPRARLERPVTGPSSAQESAQSEPAQSAPRTAGDG